MIAMENAPSSQDFFSCTLHRLERRWAIAIAGAIDERFDFDDVLREVLALPGPVALHCAEVARLNPGGICRLARLVAALVEAGVEVTFRGCPPVVVTHINQVPWFVERATVASVLAPYCCKQTGDEVLRLLKLDELEDLDEIPVFHDERGAWELDEDPERFFAFMRR